MNQKQEDLRNRIKCRCEIFVEKNIPRSNIFAIKQLKKRQIGYKIKYKWKNHDQDKETNGKVKTLNKCQNG